jgi:hypothetical protein
LSGSAHPNAGYLRPVRVGTPRVARAERPISQ